MIRQTIQVGVAASLAIVAGELLSTSRWFWAVIAAFVTFTGTSTRGETLSKGWQRVVGTVLGVPIGVLVATAVGGEFVWSIGLIFVALFAGFYLVQVSYTVMTFCITTMLALLYGTVSSMRSTSRLTLNVPSSLHQQFEHVRSAAKPLSTGLSGVGGRTGVHHVLRILAACDRYGRTITQTAYASSSGVAHVTAMAGPVRDAVDRVGEELWQLAGRGAGTRVRGTGERSASATAALDAADRVVAEAGDRHPDLAAVQLTLRCLRLIDAALGELVEGGLPHPQRDPAPATAAREIRPQAA